MISLRRHIHRSCWHVATLILAALIIRLLVPTGYMPGMVDGAVVMRPCDGQRAKPAMMNMAMPSGDHAHASHDDDRGEGGQHGGFDAPCAFSGLATPALAATDPILLAAAIAFILASAFRMVTARGFRRDAHLRPPPQGPPTTA